MGYVATGHARMRILDPDLTLDEYLLSPGDVYFAPRAFPHHIENISDDEFLFLIFFDQPTPGDIGYRATATAFSREVLAGTLGIPRARAAGVPVHPGGPADRFAAEPGRPGLLTTRAAS
jgi:oxalate decarboxylase